jgi:hypothetical protein
MKIALLGPTEIDLGGRPVVIGAAKERALLSVLGAASGPTCVDRGNRWQHRAQRLTGADDPPG